MAHRVNRFGPKNDGRFEVALRSALSPRKVVEWRDTSGFENAETWEVSRQQGDIDFSTSGRFSRQYHADPIFTPLFLSIIGPGTISFFGTTVSLASLASAIATTAVVAGISYLLAPKPPKPEEVRNPLTQALPPKFWVGGECRLAGAYLLWESTDERLFSVQGIAGHRITSFKTFYLHDDIVTLINPAGGNIYAVGDRYAGGAVSLFPRLGVVPETPISVFVSILGGEGVWTNNHRLDGQASIGMMCTSVSQKKMPKVYPMGRPVLAPVVEGAPFWDFRDPDQDPDDDSTWVYSKNSALFLAWHLCFNPYGERLDFRRAILPVLDMWQEEADVCDEDVPKAAGGTEKRYECNGFDTADHDPKGGTNAILATCDGWLCTRGDGAMLFVAGKYRSKYVVTLSDADIIGHRIDDDVLFDDEVNRFTAKFTYAATDYTTTDVDSFDDVPAQVIAGRVLPQEGNFPFVQQWRQARRLGKREFERMRQKKRGSLDVRLTGINAIYAPWILLDTPNRLPELDGKVISNRRSVVNLMAGGFQTSWVLMPSDIDAWTPAEDEGSAPPIPAKPTSAGMPVPVIDTLVALASSGSVFIRVIVVDPDRADFDYLVMYRTTDVGSGPGAWVEREITDAVPSGGLVTLDTAPVPNDTLLDIVVRFISSSGTRGPATVGYTIFSSVAPVINGFDFTINNNSQYIALLEDI